MTRFVLFAAVLFTGLAAFGQTDINPEGVDDIMDNVLLAIVGAPLIAALVTGIQTAVPHRGFGAWARMNGPTMCNFAGMLFAILVYSLHPTLFGDPPDGNLGPWIAAGWLLGYTAAGVQSQARDFREGAVTSTDMKSNAAKKIATLEQEVPK